MKGHENSLKFESCNEEAAIHVLNTKTEARKSVNQQGTIAPLLGKTIDKMNKELELGNNIDLRPDTRTFFHPSLKNTGHHYLDTT